MQNRRQIVDNLEKELWIWRKRCKSEGKNISKRLVQARAKWSFHKNGIPDFKVSNDEQNFDTIIVKIVITTITRHEISTF